MGASLACRRAVSRLARISKVEALQSGTKGREFLALSLHVSQVVERQAGRAILACFLGDVTCRFKLRCSGSVPCWG
jgi:hypothetical protein